VLHDEQGTAKVRGERKRKDTSKLLHEGDGVYILMVLMYEKTYLVAETISYLYLSHILIVTAVAYAVLFLTFHDHSQVPGRPRYSPCKRFCSSSHLLHIVYMIFPLFPTDRRESGPYTVA
jgi:hypothetical protein